MLYLWSSCVISRNSPLILQLVLWQRRRGEILSVMHATRCELLKCVYFYRQCKSFLTYISIFCSVLKLCWRLSFNRTMVETVTLLERVSRSLGSVRCRVDREDPFTSKQAIQRDSLRFVVSWWMAVLSNRFALNDCFYHPFLRNQLVFPLLP